MELANVSRSSQEETAECVLLHKRKVCFLRKGSYAHIYACKYKDGKFIKMFWIGNTFEAVMNDPSPPMLRARQSFPILPILELSLN